MTAGISATNLANVWLNILRNTTGTAIAAVFVKLHTGDPGAAGANNAAVGSTTRPAVTWSAPASGSMAITGTAPSWTNGGTSETLSHVSFWDSSTAGNFLGSAALSATQAWASGNVYTLSACTWALTPIAA
jgi:hypothetical protein